MMQQQDVARVLTDPLAQELMQSNIPARLAYVGPDGFPRAMDADGNIAVVVGLRKGTVVAGQAVLKVAP